MNYRLRVAVALTAILVILYVILADLKLIHHVTVFQTPVVASGGVLHHNLTNTRTEFINPTGLPSPIEETNKDFTGLNKHTWENTCLNSIQHLCNFPLFPKAPDSREVVNNIDITRLSFGHRFFGFLHPNTSSEFHFAIASNGFAEIWLSPSENWREANRVAYVNPRDFKTPPTKGNFDALKSQISDGIQLKSGGKYYFEVAYSQEVENGGETFIQVAWSRQGKSDLEIIEGKFFSPFVNDSYKSQRKMFDDNLPDAPSCVEFKTRHVNRKYMNSEDLSYLKAKAVENTLPYCEYRPSYLLKPADLNRFGPYHGVYKYVRRTYSFPFTNVEGLSTGPMSPEFVAESPLQETEARAVVNSYKTALDKANPGKYKLESIVRVEKKEDPEKGSRYFLELKVKDLKTGSNHILAEYVYRPQKANPTYCYPKGMQWNRTADVYLILTSKNLGRWVHHFIKNMEQIVRETKDPHIHVVIFDFESADIDLKEALKQSSLTSYHFITQPGKYSRGLSFSEAIKSVTDPNAIVVMIDLHLDIGSRFINDIRKHCLKGKTIYAPQIVFLDCYGSSAYPQGRWYHNSYGTIAMYKEDWEKFGGFSPQFLQKVSWGGEDWDVVDNAVKGGLEVERKRGPWIYHYQHNKNGMW